MSCLSREQLARMALGLESGSGTSAHLQICLRCHTDLESLRSLVRQLAPPLLDPFFPPLARRRSLAFTSRPDRL
jgi:hypothetical protein